MSSKVSGLLSESLDPVLQREMVAPALAKAFPAALPLITAINKAHVLMLRERGIVAHDVARSLAGAILDLERQGPGAFELDPAREDSYFNYEARLVEMVGADVGGRVHVARSRNDLYATMDRLRARGALMAITRGMLDLRAAMLERATLHRDVLMPGYTHMQPAQPITFGYYLAGIAQALERDHRRFAESWPRLNRGPLGAGALAGTSFPIDRAMTARLLGFESVEPHAQDSIGARDQLLELLSIAAIAATNWGRMAQDFFFMTTYEFATLAFPDTVAQTSSMMPQKRNMTTLEHLKASAAIVLGAQVTALAGFRGANASMMIDACVDSFHWAWDALDETRRALAVAEVVVRAAEPRRERMRELVHANFATATDLADALVREAGLSFREAHHLVGAVVRTAMAKGLTADRIDAALVAAEARAMLGRDLALPAAAIAGAVDPAKAAEARRGTGGPAREDVDAMLAAMRTTLARDAAEFAARRDAVAAAEARLDEAFRALAA
ncbi:MAG: argininosuccinate lyase [Alphaproteobacteria bacterium]|nr:argininosuccinate lyase [Alphaproteobacteria bacterium]